MEFYFNLIGLRKIKFMFQFPTGWNSTLAPLLNFALCFQFQFPTGWNSTMDSSFWKSISASFNSQRDGILLSSISDSDMDMIRFNSQRDGILRYWSKYWAWASRQFQFPTGWNSTMSDLSVETLIAVSIPNGMKFYAGNMRILSRSLGFNS